MIAKALLLAFLVGAASAYEFEDSQLVDESQARFLYFNSSSTATSLTLLGAVILLGVIFYLVYAGGILGGASSAYNRNDYYQQQQPYEQYQYSRSANDGYGMGDMNILKWLAMAQEVYNKFDLTSMDCQKKVVCEIVQQQEVFGSASRSLESSFQFASLLENFNLPDDVRDILDEYMDASEQANGQKNCEEVFDCPFSIADAVKRSFYGNSL